MLSEGRQRVIPSRRFKVLGGEPTCRAPAAAEDLRGISGPHLSFLEALYGTLLFHMERAGFRIDLLRRRSERKEGREVQGDLRGGLGKAKRENE